MALRLIRTLVMAFLLATILFTMVGFLGAKTVSASTCYGSSCNNLDPSGRCTDGKTVGAMGVKDGMIELRWSEVCHANWTRYTPYARTVTTYLSTHYNTPGDTPHDDEGSEVSDHYSTNYDGILIYARVTVWNPGQDSYGVAHSADNPYGSTWSKMTDGNQHACSGVEVIHIIDGESYSQGWYWGPCY